MARRRFITSGAREEDATASSLDAEMKATPRDSSSVDYDAESEHDSNSAFGTAVSPQSPNSSDRTLPVPWSNMQNSTMLSEPSARHRELASPSSLSRHAIEQLCNKYILNPLATFCLSRGFYLAFEELFIDCRSDIFHKRIICLRDLEKILLNEMKVSTHQGRHT